MSEGSLNSSTDSIKCVKLTCQEIRAITFEMLVGGMSGIDSSDHPRHFFIIFLRAISAGQVRPPPTLQFHFSRGRYPAVILFKFGGGYSYKMGMGGKN